MQGPSVSPSRSADNDIGNAGCTALAEALKSNTSVTSVGVSCMLVYDWGVVGPACVVVDMTGGMRGAGDGVFLRGRSVKQRSVHEEYALVVRFRGGGGSDDVLLHDDTSAETRPHTHCSVEWSTFPPPSPLHSSHELPPKGRVPGDSTLRAPPPEVAPALRAYSVGVPGRAQCWAHPQDLQQHRVPRNARGTP